MLKRINEDLWINPIGYCNRNDVTNLNERYLVAGSQNVLIENIDDSSTRVMTRWGFEKCRSLPANVGSLKFLNAYRWDTNDTKTRYVVSYLYTQTNGSSGVNTFIYEIDLCTGNQISQLAHGAPSIYSDWNTVDQRNVRYASFYDYKNLKEVLLWVDGNTNPYICGVDSSNTNISTPFFATNNNSTNPGVLPPFPPGYTLDYIAVFNNQLYLGSRNSRVVYVSRCTTDSTFFGGNFPAYTDFRFTQYAPAQQIVQVDGNGNSYVVDVPAAGRQPCEGAEILLDSNCRGFGQQNGVMEIFTDKHLVYEVEVAQGQYVNTEEIRVRRLKTSNGQGAMSQELITEIKNGIIYITREKTVDILSDIESFSSVQAKPINDVVQADFDNFDYSDAKMMYHKRNLYITFPKNATVMIYNLERGFWQPPQKMVIGGFVAKDDIIYGFEYVSDGTADFYRMDCFNFLNKIEAELTLTDDGAPFTARIVTPYTHLGVRNHQKFHTSIFTEGYINEVSEIKVKCLYEYGGYKGEQAKIIYGYRKEGDKRDFIYKPIDKVSIGKSQMGENNLGNKERYIIPKFHQVKKFTPKPNYYERQISFEGDVAEQRWGIISFSTNANLVSDTNQAATE